MRHASIDEKIYGAEPVWDSNKDATELELGLAYNWYNYFHDYKVSKKYVLDYLKSQKTGREILDRISNLPDLQFATIGWTCRIISRGANLSDGVKDRLKLRLQTLIYDAKPKEQAEKASGPSIQQRMAAQLDSYLAEFEDQLDKFTEAGCHSEFKPYDFLRAKDVKGPYASQIAKFYQPQLVEVIDFLENPDDQLREGYSRRPRAQMKRLLAFLTMIIEDCSKIFHNAKISRKPRIKKRKSVDQIVSKIKYKSQDDAFKIKSISPTELVGAQALWFFNTKTRKLGVYHAANPDGLNMKGTTILNYDEKLSMSKTLRKPDQVLNNVIQGGKVLLRGLMEDINSKVSPLNGRINKDIVLLRATK